MKKILLIPLLLILLHPIISAQTPSLKFLLHDRDGNKSIAGAEAILYYNSDSIKIITKKNGEALFIGTRPGYHKLVVTAMGYKTITRDFILLEKETSLGIVYMEYEYKTLNEVVVEAEKSSIESQPGKRILHLGKDITNAGGTVADVLNRIPSVETTPRGQVSIRGNSNVKIYINGRETRRVTTTLSQIPVDLIEKIEVITNPSAKFTADGTAGIINVIYKQVTKDNLRIQTTLQTGYPWRGQPGLNINYKKGKWSYYANTVYRYNSGMQWTNSERTYDKDTTNRSLLVYNNISTASFKNNFWEINIGSQFSPDSFTTISLDLSRHFDNYEAMWKQASSFGMIGSPATFTSIKNRNLEREKEISYSISFAKKLKKGRILQLNYSLSGEIENNSLDNNTENKIISNTPLAASISRSDTREKQRIHEFRADYVLPLRKAFVFETGIKTDYVSYDIFQQLISNKPGFSIPNNDFSVLQFKQAAYLLLKRKYKKLQFEIGTRLESFHNKSKQVNPDTTFRVSNTQLFPNLQLQYQFNKTSFSFSFSRRINQPGFFDVNPYLSYDDPLTISTGNPFLRPVILYAYEISFDRSWGETKLNNTIYYRDSRNSIQAVVQSINDSVTLGIRKNVSGSSTTGTEGTINTEPVKWLELLFGYSLYYTHFRQGQDKLFLNDFLAWSVRYEQNMKFSKYYKFQVSGNYRSNRISLQTKFLPRYNIDVAIQKQFKNKRGGITLSVPDFFNTNRFGNRIFGNGFTTTNSSQFQSRRLQLQLQYNLIKK